MTALEIVKMAMPLIVLECVLKIFCLFKLYKDEVKHLPKAVWALIIIFVSTFGPISFLFLGRKKD